MYMRSCQVSDLSAELDLCLYNHKGDYKHDLVNKVKFVRDAADALVLRSWNWHELMGDEWQHPLDGLDVPSDVPRDAIVEGIIMGQVEGIAMSRRVEHARLARVEEVN
jgi:hypothetical protein